MYYIPKGTLVVAYNISTKECGKTVTLNENSFVTMFSEFSGPWAVDLLAEIMIKVFNNDVKKYSEVFPVNRQRTIRVSIFRKRQNHEWWLLVGSDKPIFEEEM
jgi:hypothetical protein